MLPATGETRCWNEFGLEIRCDSEDFPGQDGAYQAGCPNDGRFVLSEGQDTVVDRCTGLEWAREPSTEIMIWQHALQYCDSIELDGGGWRMPNWFELVSLVSPGPLGTSSEFVTPEGGYWSAISYVADRQSAVVTYFVETPGPTARLKSSQLWVRPVSNAQ